MIIEFHYQKLNWRRVCSPAIRFLLSSLDFSAGCLLLLETDIDTKIRALCPVLDQGGVRVTMVIYLPDVICAN